MQTAFPTVSPIKLRSQAFNGSRTSNQSGAFTRSPDFAGSSAARSSIYAGRLFSRRAVDLRARLITRRQVNGRIMEGVVHGRTVDLSRSGAGLTLFRELPAGAEVVFSVQLPNGSEPLCLKAMIVHRRGFRAGLIFAQPTAEQRLLLCEFCYA